MTMRVTRHLRGANNEGILAAIIVAIVVVMSLVNPDFFSAATAFSVARNILVNLVLAMGVLVVMISGGIDVSFTAIAVCAAYTAILVGTEHPALAAPWAVALLTAALGALLGAGNGVLISQFKLPTLIVTLGTQGIYRGLLLAFVGSSYLANLPDGLDALSGATLAQVSRAGVTTKLHGFIIPVLAVCLVTAWVLSRTVAGRCLYAMGGDVQSARRAGIPVRWLQLGLYTTVGLLAGLAGLMHMVLSRNANPSELVGTELDVIAAVVLGGAAITGGRGSVTGTVLGVTLIGVINGSLVMLGVPGSWQRAAVGALLLVGLTAQAMGARRRSTSPSGTLVHTNPATGDPGEPPAPGPTPRRSQVPA